MVTNNAWNSQDPAQVSKGGTGDSSFTAYTVICAGTTSTSNLQNVVNTGTAGQCLTSNGAGALPTWQSNGTMGKVVRQVFTGSGTYTPSSGMLYCDIECLGAGGGGAGGNGAGGGAGGYCRKVFPAATIGVSQTITIGAGASGGAAGNAGGTGGTSSVGVLLSSTGGTGGQFSTLANRAAAGVGGTGSGGDFNTTGQGGRGLGDNDYAPADGGNSFFGGGGQGSINDTVGGNATSYGGGGGAAKGPTDHVGGNGFAGIVIVTEYTT